MNMLCDIFLWVFDATIGASLVAFMVIAIKKFFHHRISARLHHALWLIVLIRLLFPFLPDSPVSIFNIWQLGVDSIKNAVPPHSPVANDASQKEIEQNSKQTNSPQNDKTKQPENQKLLDPSISHPIKIDPDPIEDTHTLGVKIAAIVWLIGCISLLGFMCAYLLRTRSRMSSLKVVTDPQVISILDDCRKRFGITKPIPIFSGSDRKSPHISGLIHPWIYCPEEICKESNTSALTHVFSHELAHYKRKDIAWNLLGLLALAIHWMNPFIWMCVKQMKSDRELACDAYVLNVLGEDESVPYGMTIIQFLQRFSTKRQPLHLLPFTEANNKNQLIRRIQMIKSFKAGSYKLSVAAVLCVALMSSVTLTNAAVKVESTVKPVASDQANTEQEARLLFDSDERTYDRLSKGMQTTGFAFKVPDVLAMDYEFRGMYIDQRKLRTNKETHVQIEFRGPSSNDVSFSASSGLHGLEAAYKIIVDEQIKGDEEQKIQEQNLNVQGLDVMKVTFLSPKNHINYVYYLWQDNGIQYNIGSFASDPQEDIVKMISNVKYPDQTMKERYVGYSSYVMGLHDTEDVQHGSKAIGFTPKFPLELPGQFKATAADISSKVNFSMPANEEDYKTLFLGINYDVAEKNKRLKWEDRISFDQIKDTKIYEDMKKNGNVAFHYAMDEAYKVKVNMLKIAGNEVFKTEKYKRFGESSKAEDPTLISYFWRENDVCFKVTFTDEVSNEEEIVSYLMSQKAVDFQNLK
ncbi:M56 family metallopeptidase [Brevibacillus antibioticus]|uniref:M56 family metallopeptidase n=1 Tax=Brevibacillus antibioticus TaxID=2570228 RepID=A0A4V5TIK9_9BACL|nr:M56 family metallopeptidase [Brevibacillus antibioticus]TKI54323.1 M56 family metallopeptidase [Brevibacillus antibioticus]